MTTFDQRRKVGIHQSPLPTKAAGNEVATPTPTAQTPSVQTVQRARVTPDALRPAEVQFLQSRIGNAAVGNLLGRNQSQRAQPGVVQRQPLSISPAPAERVQRSFRDLFRRKKKNTPQHLTDNDLETEGHQRGEGGTANVVDKVTYNKPIGKSRSRKGFFKRDNREYEEKGIQMSDRAVASSRLANWLGLDVIAENSYATHGGEKGSVSAQVPGMPLMEVLFNNPTSPNFDIDDYEDKSPYKQVNGKWMMRSGFHYNSPDMKNPTTQKGLADLQLFDFIKGESDRHGGNIYVDPVTGGVKGIDDDQGFQAGVYRTERKPEEYGSGISEKHKGLPSLVDEKTAKLILKHKAKNLPKVLKGTISDDEIKVTQARMRKLKRHVKQLRANKQLVKEWDKKTYTQTLQEENLDIPGWASFERSYLKRHEMAQQNVTNNDEVGEEIAPGGMPWSEENQLYEM